jgi:hypothetical protein
MQLFDEGKVDHPPPQGRLYSPLVHQFVRRNGAVAASMDAWLTIPDAMGYAPRVQRGSLVRPEFCFGKQSAYGSYGFIVRTPRGPVFLTALHVLDEVIKVKGIDASPENSGYTGRELAAVVERVNLYDVLEEKWMFHLLGSCRQMYVLANARVGECEPVSYRDVAAFAVHEGDSLRGIALSPRCPAIGEPVWLATKEASPRKAVVVERTAKTFVFRYATKDALPRHSSGAPILDEGGRLVAINVGTGSFRGQLLGNANHVESIRQHLELVA